MSDSNPHYNLTDLKAMLAAEVRQRNRDRRERIATAALQGMLASVEGGLPPKDWTDIYAHRAVAYADALIEELDKEPQP